MEQQDRLPSRVCAHRVFTPGQLEQIHHASLEVLRRTGVEVRLPWAVERLKKAGCWVEGWRVRFPARLVEWAIEVAPSRVVLYNREGEPALYVEGLRSYFGTGSDCIHVTDVYSGERRKATIKDVADFARVVDALPNMDFNLGMSAAHDVPPEVADLHQFCAMVTNTTKPMVFASWSARNLRAIVEMCEVVAGGATAYRQRPFAYPYGSPISPLQFAAEDTAIMLFAADQGLPYTLGPSAIAGGTAPMTLAGAMVQMNAEMLAGLVMYELQREGAAFIICCGSPIPMDMRTGIACYGSPESWAFQSGMVELQQYQGLPTFGLAGCTDAKVFDEQAAIEGAVSLLLAGLSGVNMIHDVGYMEYGKASSFEMVVTMDEMIGQIRFILNGIEVSPETMGLDVIDEVGPGGEYLTKDHTLRHFKEAWVPQVIGERRTYEAWAARGAKTLRQRANERARQILEGYEPRPLAPAVRSRLEAIRDSVAA